MGEIFEIMDIDIPVKELDYARFLFIGLNVQKGSLEKELRECVVGPVIKE